MLSLQDEHLVVLELVPHGPAAVAGIELGARLPVIRGSFGETILAPSLLEYGTMEGRRRDRCPILNKPAEGGMGEVYLAVHALMGREVVIELLLPQMSMQRGIIERFFHEAGHGQPDHPGIVEELERGARDEGSRAARSSSPTPRPTVGDRQADPETCARWVAVSSC